MDNTNRKCIFGNDLLQGTQSNVGFPAAVAVGFFGHNWMSLIIVHSFTTYTFLAHLLRFCEIIMQLFVLISIEQNERLPTKGTSSHKCHLPFTDSIVLLKQKRSKVVIAKPAKTLIISFNNNTPLLESNPVKHPVKF